MKIETKNVNQYRFDKLPNSKIIITAELYERLLFLIGRTAWVPSEHMCIFYGKEIQENTVYFDKVNIAEDYDSKGEGSKNPLDYSVGPGAGNFGEELEENIKSLPKGTIIADIHTHPSNVITGKGDENEYRYYSTGDLKTNIRWDNYIKKYGLTHIAGLIGVDRVNGNMTISFIWFDASKSKFYLFDNVLLDKVIDGQHVYTPFTKVGDVQLIYENWGQVDVPLSSTVKKGIKNLK